MNRGKQISLENHLKNYYQIRNVIEDRLDLQQGMIKSRYLLRKLNKSFDIKHNYNLGYPAKGIKPLPQDVYEGLKIYTIARTLSLYKLLK